MLSDFIVVKKDNLTEAEQWLEKHNYVSAICQTDKYIAVELDDGRTVKCFDTDVLAFELGSNKLKVFCQKAFEAYCQKEEN